MSSATEQWGQLLTPAVMQGKLISASLYVTAFELLKESIIGRICSFYMVGFDADGDLIDEKYETVVLSKNKNPLLASLDWLAENDVIDENDRQAFERIRTARNLLAHQLPSMVMGGKDFQHIERFQELVALLKKIEVWWVVNMEIPVNPDFDGKEIDEEGIVPGPVLMLQMMLEVVSGNEELLKHYRANSNAAAGL
ncbi:MAG: hypothetical protein ACYCYL_11050 [Acidithiobacillus sp.]